MNLAPLISSAPSARIPSRLYCETFFEQTRKRHLCVDDFVVDESTKVPHGAIDFNKLQQKRFVVKSLEASCFQRLSRYPRFRFGTSGLTQRKSFRFNISQYWLVEPCGFHAHKSIYIDTQEIRPDVPIH
jgi:hypothetical protein